VGERPLGRLIARASLDSETSCGSGDNDQRNDPAHRSVFL